MKKTLTAMAMATTIIAGTAQADLTDPVTQAKVKDWFDQTVPFIKVAEACKMDNRFEYIEWVMDQAHMKAGSIDEIDRGLVNMWYQTGYLTAPIDKSFRAVIKYAKNPDTRQHPKIVEACDHTSNKIQELIKG